MAICWQGSINRLIGPESGHKNSYSCQWNVGNVAGFWYEARIIPLKTHLDIVRARLTKHVWRNFNFAPRCACTHTLFKSMCKIFLKLANEPIIEQQLVPFRQMVKSLAEGQSRHQNREETGLKWLWWTWLLMLMSVSQPADLLGLSAHHSHLYG